MQLKNLLLPLIVMAVAPAASAHEEDVGAIEALGRINGQALACRSPVAEQAKTLMLKHAPRTARFGSAFEQATQAGFMEQIKAGACPDDLVARFGALAGEIARTMPAIE